MKLSSYIDLIRVLPYKEQSFKTSKETWVKYCSKDKDFEKYFHSAFEKSTIEISRGDLFGMVENGDFRSAIFSIILWGYPRGYTRPNTMSKLFPQFLESVGIIEEILNKTENLTSENFKGLLKVKGVGLSTISKILYFLRIEVDGFQSLILDSRIIDVIQYEKFDELKELKEITEFSKDKYYIKYIKAMGELSNKYNCEIDQLELFLFLFGNNLKTIV